MCAFIAFVIYFLISTPLYKVDVEGIDPEDCQRLALFRIRAKMWAHYKRRRGSDPQWKKKKSELWNLTEKMLGKSHKPMLNVKAAEAKGLLAFVLELLEEAVPKLVEHGPFRMRGEFLLQAARAAVEVNTLLSSQGANVEVTPQEQQTLMDHYIRHVTMFRRGGGCLLPKHHLMVHLIQQCRSLGAPWLRATYFDESLNGVIARIARSSHRNTFSETIHYKYAALQELAGPSAQHMRP